MIGRVEPNSVSTFVSKTKLKKSTFRGYNNLQFADRNCKAEHERLKKITEKST
jgi:hypothetical protein